MNLTLNKDGNPCREAAQYMADFFMGIAENESNKLDFGQSEIVSHECGTVACHGGYGLFLLSKAPIEQDFIAGSNAISEVMGFESAYDFRRWARRNPDKWGSVHGRLMFDIAGWLAFGSQRRKEVDLLAIADWYAAMAPRLQPSDNGWRIE